MRRTKARLILLSDSRVYGVAKTHRIYAENEYAGIDNTAFETFDNQLLRAVEALMNCEQKAHGFEMTTLRTGIILGACTGINTFLDDTLRAVAQGKETALFSSDHKYSFVYITDVFRAIVYSITTLETNQIYNIAGINSTLSTASVAAILHDIYGTDAQITLTDNEEKGFCPISTGKSETYGFSAAINIETALELCVMSFMTDKSGLSLPNTHDGRLDAIQKIQLAYLLEVDRICRKHDIKYFLGGGTLLGAIRHKGFIPWDDDSDIMMLREDYEKFCQIAVSELPANMSFQSNKTDRNCFYEFAKLRIDDTAFATVFAKEHKSMHNGIAFDIFCHDKTANSRFGQKLHMAMTIFTRALVFNKWNHRKTENGSRMQTAFTNFCVRLFPLRFSCRLMNHTISFFKRKKNAKYLYDGMGRNVYNGVFPIELLDEVIYVDFEGYPLPVPKRYDEYLKFLYGDYMVPPPPEKQVTHHDYELFVEDDGAKMSRNGRNVLNMKKILILGAPVFQIPVVQTAKQMGMTVGIVDINADAPAFACADETFECSIRDTEGVLKIAREFRPDGIVIGACDTSVVTGARVCETLGLPGNSVEASLNSTDKVRMLEAFQRHNVAHPLFQVVRRDEVERFTMALPYPVITKPTDSAGGRGISIVHGEAGLREAARFSSDAGLSGDILIEEYMSGPEVSVEVLVVDGVPHVLQITDKLTSGEPNFFEIGHSQPSALPGDVKERIRQLASAAVLAVGLVNSAAHVEIKITEDGPKMVELGCRLGGDCITSYLLDTSVTGVSMTRAAIELALGQKPDVKSYADSGVGVGVRFIPARKGVLRSIDALAAAGESDVIALEITGKIGKRYQDATDDSSRFGYVVCRGETPQKALDRCQEIIDTIRITLDP